MGGRCRSVQAQLHVSVWACLDIRTNLLTFVSALLPHRFDKLHKKNIGLGGVRARGQILVFDLHEVGLPVGPVAPGSCWPNTDHTINHFTKVGPIELSNPSWTPLRKLECFSCKNEELIIQKRHKGLPASDKLVFAMIFTVKYLCVSIFYIYAQKKITSYQIMYYITYILLIFYLICRAIHVIGNIFFKINPKLIQSNQTHPSLSLNDILSLKGWSIYSIVQAAETTSLIVWVRLVSLLIPCNGGRLGHWTTSFCPLSNNFISSFTLSVYLLKKEVRLKEFLYRIGLDAWETRFLFLLYFSSEELNK